MGCEFRRKRVDFHTEFTFLVMAASGNGTVLSDSDYGSFNVASGDVDGESTTLSLNVQSLRPGTVGIYGTTRLECVTDWFASEDTHPVYLTLGGH